MMALVVGGLACWWKFAASETIPSSAARGESQRDGAPNSQSVTPAERRHQDQDLASLPSRVAALEATVKGLRAQLVKTGSAKRSAASASDETARDAHGGDQLGGEAFLDALETDASPVRERMQQFVREEFKEWREQHRDVRMAAREARDDERNDNFAKRAGLNPEQKRKLDDAVAAERDKLDEIFRQAREDFNFREARQQARAYRQGTDQQLAAIFDKAQLQAWMDMRAQRGRH